ncbi:MAG: hypothetical protein B7Y54_02655 [Polaromonas sp. 35-63-240]|uniref:ChbG/HpnK family deacetylase n=1 Tax=Polaromonas sp. TaxID=1869339 RepID=UPI000BCFA2A2|nr:ChbG/HpnK family deacetylase [Polaromonas sp.]OYY53522.1 MAG: hypothetical protein B7Y54_02655 [Polaromonas sp. 35-63-240]OYZ00802.1 MAG: hypothetical protein B7Y42_04255 [Polaromonas sp. 28-63-22]HQS32791.1 ChbG/HpnK family deacetylase [Polaromonas sp.]HQS92074.1 ChbG/HpnK family deacetylase [Polaromonas sp.]
MTPRMPADVLLCADDFAFNAACSQAIIELAAASRIQATSAMVLSPRWAHDAPRLRAAQGTTSVGLHLDWTSDFARAEGHGLPLGQAMLRAAWGGFSGAGTRRVIARQLDLFEKHWGGPPDHIDGHQHVHQFAGIRDALLAEITGRYPQHRPWLRISNPTAQCQGIKPMLIRAQGASALKALSEQLSVPCMPFLSGIYDFQGGELHYRELLAQWQREARAGTVIMCHPATAAEPGDSIGAARVWEYAVLRAETPAVRA